ncbi:hypothetical protein SD10_13045 [Spirosoma radiotolerans]|uniref:ATP-grasp fold RimK-type domain-containing protein n=2 Tax=Spirosoma radiotolerans TaxID=1379870 RepID=A0A0E3ZWH1_9BACT|nr:hypothetical protein SD10_13045 [Spirosoma radiotolerans]
MCIKASKAVGLEFSGVDLIREKMGKTYVTEVNGNPGTGIIDITKKNHFADLIKFIETKSKKKENIPAPVPLPDADKDDKQHQENEEEASLKRYKELSVKQEKSRLDYNESALLSFFKKKFGNI